MKVTTIYRLVGINVNEEVIWAQSHFYADKQEAKAALDCLMHNRKMISTSEKVEPFEGHPWVMCSCGDFPHVTVERLYNVSCACSVGSRYYNIVFGIATYKVF